MVRIAVAISGYPSVLLLLDLESRLEVRVSGYTGEGIPLPPEVLILGCSPLVFILSVLCSHSFASLGWLCHNTREGRLLSGESAGHLFAALGCMALAVLLWRGFFVF